MSSELLTAEQLGYDWNKIPSFGEVHTFANFYQELVDTAPVGATIVEVGCYCGRSLVHLGLLAKHSGKNLRIVGVDHGIDQSNGLGNEVRKYVAEANLEGIVNFIEKDSAVAAREWTGGPIWCAFIDGGHLHEEVEKDIDAWMPLVDEGGLLAGHDVAWWTVWQPVKAKLPLVVHDPMYEECWFVKKCTPLTNVDIHTEIRIPGKEGPAHFGYGCDGFRNDGKPSGSPLLT